MRVYTAALAPEEHERPGRPRRYSSTTCLNRYRVRAYRRRQRQAHSQ